MSQIFLFSPKPTHSLATAAQCAFRELKGLNPAATWQTPTGELLTFNATAGRAVAVTRRMDASNWLMITGTWFDDAGLGPGDEHALLAEIERDGLHAAVSKLEGFFTLVFGNEASNEIHVVTDLGGSCHCYMRELEDGIAICTSSSVLAALGRGELDPIGAQEFLATGVIYETRSLWRDVKKIAPATIITLRAGRVQSELKYWRFADITPQRYSLDESVERIAAALTSAARRIGKHFNKPLCDLTGGYDSRATIAGFLLAGVPVNTTVSGPSDSPDVIVSTSIAKAFGITHSRIEPLRDLTLEQCAKAFAYTDGEYDMFEYARIAHTHEQHATQFDLSVNGSFGELARGYWWELLLPNLGATNKLDYAMLATKRYGALPYEANLFASDTKIPLVPHLTDALARAGREVEHFPNTSQMDNAYYALRMQRWQGRIASSTNHIWPAISPYAFRSLLIPVIETDWHARIRSLVVRALLQRKVPKLGNLPLEHGYPAVPATLGNLHRFWPIPMHYAGRAYHKLKRMAGLSASGSTRLTPFAVALCARDEFKELLAFPALRASALLDPRAFEEFLAHAQQVGFVYGEQFSRVITLEYSLSRVKSAAQIVSGKR